MQSASFPAVCLVYLCASVGPRGATHCSACPALRHSESGPLGLSVCECRAAGSASGQTACPFRPTLRQSQSRHGHASPLHPGCPSPPLLPLWMNVSSLSPWLLDCHTDFLAVLVVFLFLNCCCPSFGCARRHSVSTYASILARSPFLFFNSSQ